MDDRARDAEIERYFRDLLEVVRLPSGAGARVFQNILDRFGLFAPVYAGGERTFYLIGRQEAARELLLDLAAADPEAMLTVLKEGCRRMTRRMDAGGKGESI